MNIIAKLLYRPSENHVGAIYRLGRFNRFADPDRWSPMIPWIEWVEKESKLDMRVANIQLGDVYTRNNIALDMELKIFFFVDLRLTHQDRRIQVLRFGSEAAWEEIIRTGITDIARNVIILTRSFEELATQEGRSNLKHELSSALAERVRGFGILVNPRFGVNIINLQPNETYQQALQEESIAHMIGTAAADRIQPLFEQFKDQNQEKAFLTLVMQIAAAVAKNGQSPDLIFPNNGGFLSGGGIGGNGHGPFKPNIPGMSPPRKPRSVAGD